MEFQNKVAVVTGGAQGIGKAIADAFRKGGATVYVIDIQKGDWFVGDVSDKSALSDETVRLLLRWPCSFARIKRDSLPVKTSVLMAA